MTQSTTPQPTLGMGCWPIGGAMFSGNTSLGYSNADDAMSIRTIHAALDGGITLFDTAAAYGAGHSERLLGQALEGRSDVTIVTKVGIPINEIEKSLRFDTPRRDDIMPAIDACLGRLKRDRIDLLLLHPNETSITDAVPIFDVMEHAVRAGKIGGFGWSTDISDNVTAMAQRPNFTAVEHAMNVFFDAAQMQATLTDLNMTALIRSPLAMGVLGGKYGAGVRLDADDIRASNEPWMEYFRDGEINPAFLAKLEAVRDLLSTGGRTLVQGALGWIWAKNPRNIPIPGARTVDQITGLAEALAFGPLGAATMVEIDGLIEQPTGPERPR